jgi:ABC-type lipoprotein release transport system permease subunit
VIALPERWPELVVRIALGATAQNIVATLSALIPAMRATRVDPTESLRSE